MNRVTLNILAYWLAIAGGIAALFLWLPWPPGLRHILVASVFLVPGRLQGMLWRDFFRGRRAMDTGDVQQALTHFLRFAKKLGQRPWLRHAIFLQWSFYTWIAHAMLANNIGACQLRLGDWSAAEASLERALTLDAGCPLPYFNLAIIAQVRGQA